MSERESITTELRDLILRSPHEQFDCFPPVTRVSMDEHKVLTICDAIDAVHVGLERENAELRARVAEAELDNRSESMHIGGSITDGLRKFIEDPLLGYATQDQHIELLTKIADRIDAEHERQLEVLYRDMSDAEYVKLPVDADGEPIHIGDEMVLQHEVKEKPYVVQSFTWDGEDWYFTCDEGLFNVCGWMHHHAPTVEDVLREFFSRYVTTKPKDEDDAILAEYAAKLRLAGDAE